MANPQMVVEALELFHEGFTAEEVVQWASSTFKDGLVLQTSGGIQAAVMLKLVTSVVPNVKVVFVDTGYLPQDTTDYMETLRRDLNLNLTIARPKLTPGELERQYGKLWETDHDLYGQITKVEPMNRALSELGATAILSGIRSEQTSNRAGLSKVSFDMGNHLFKVLPILDWTKAQVKEFQQQMVLPKHPLESRGFTTVGDSHSSRAIKAGETDDRATRFGGKAQECGLHAQTVPVVELLPYLKQPLRPQDGYIIFSKPNCKYCKAAKRILNDANIPFIDKDVNDLEARIEMYGRAPGSKLVPQIVFDNSHIGGFEELHSKFEIGVSVEEYLQEANKPRDEDQTDSMENWLTEVDVNQAALLRTFLTLTEYMEASFQMAHRMPTNTASDMYSYRDAGTFLNLEDYMEATFRVADMMPTSAVAVH
jgi:phosphoadenosine phosphosulfate reductase